MEKESGMMPIWPPPPGVESNFVDPDNIAYMIYAAIGVTMPLALLACGLRLYTSKAIVGRWHVDDSMCDGFHPWVLLFLPRVAHFSLANVWYIVLIGIAQLLAIGYSISMCLRRSP